MRRPGTVADLCVNSPNDVRRSSPRRTRVKPCSFNTAQVTENIRSRASNSSSPPITKAAVMNGEAAPTSYCDSHPPTFRCTQFRGSSQGSSQSGVQLSPNCQTSHHNAATTAIPRLEMIP